MMEHRDCVVIGGGPAGSTFAGIARKYAPDLRLTVLEAARFPRYHIGESTIPVANAVLRDLEVYDTLERAGTIRKIGIVFVWGRDRIPWNADYLRLHEIPSASGKSHVIDVLGQDFERMFADKKTPRDTPFKAFNVKRADFDDLLLKRARDFGAEVREGTRVTALLTDAQGRTEGVRWEDDQGRTGVIETPFVLDASGLTSLVTRHDRQREPNMNNFAVYGYLRNAVWKVTYSGKRELTTVFICATERGWVWYFPIAEDVMSVGVVTNRDHFKDALKDVDVEEFWWDTLRACDELSELVKDATLRTDILPGGRRVAVSQDWSSWARSPVGPGWAAAGDASVFVDPILSQGLTLALQSGHRAAYTFNTAHRRPELPAADLWRSYADYIRGEASSFLAMARFFYGNHKAKDSWWWHAQGVVNRSGRLDLGDVHSFTMATAGFFPTPRALSHDVVGALLGKLGDAKADVTDIFRDKGLPSEEALASAALQVLTPFSLRLRGEPNAQLAPAGQLDTYHDLVPDEMAMAHRINAVPCRIPPLLEPIVRAIPGHTSVRSLLDAASGLVPQSAATARKNALDIVKIAALKGYAKVTPADAAE
jgi:clorobiocin biosynthesis protein Clo-hal